jgi:F-type H+-transporting ATPase subunit gamma
MPGLKEVRIRIASVNSTKQITSAMKMVSASKLRRSQERILGLRPYFTELKTLMKQVTFNNPFQIQSPYFENRSGGRVLFIVISSNRGLCGVFNSNVNKYIANLTNLPEFQNKYSADQTDFIVFGRRAGDYLRKKQVNIISQHDEVVEKSVTAEIFQLADTIFKTYQGGEWDEIYLIYNQFKNPAMQEVVHERLLPLELPEIQKEFFIPEIEFIYQPDLSSIFEALIPDFLKASLLKAILESSAGEHGARMTAMHKATDNATELLKDLKLSYNKARQAAITKEIIEIVSGANALD